MVNQPGCRTKKSKIKTNNEHFPQIQTHIAIEQISCGRDWNFVNVERGNTFNVCPFFFLFSTFFLFFFSPLCFHSLHHRKGCSSAFVRRSGFFVCVIVANTRIYIYVHSVCFIRHERERNAFSFFSQDLFLYFSFSVGKVLFKRLVENYVRRNEHEMLLILEWVQLQ